MNTASAVERLESRIAPAAMFTYTDVDGDLVTIKTSKGADDQLKAILTPSHFTAAGLGMQLNEIDFSADATTFAGTDLTITAKPHDPNPDDADTTIRGDGLVNIGRLDAAKSDGDGVALDLGAI